VGAEFAIAFAILITIGQIVGYATGSRPGMEYAASRRPRLSRRQFWRTVLRAAGYIVAALACSMLAHRMDHAWAFALRIGAVTGVVTGTVVTVYPFIEYYADSLPERRLGAIGIGLVLVGFVLQSVQYWLMLFDVRMT
jgi:cytochrome bd-type quinol oxidase subunit 2